MQIEPAEVVLSNFPVIVDDDNFLYPFMIVPIFINDEFNLRSLQAAQEHDKMVFVTTTKIGNSKRRNKDSIYDVGIVGRVIRHTQLADGKLKILFQGSYKARIKQVVSTSPMVVEVKSIETKIKDNDTIHALINVLKEKINYYVVQTQQNIQPDLLETIKESQEPNRICDLILSGFSLNKREIYDFFIIEDLEEKIYKIIDFIDKDVEYFRLEKEIRSKIHTKIDKNNKEYFLKEQLKEIQKELGGDDRDEEIKEYIKRLDSKKKFMSKDAYKEIKKQIDKLARLHPDSADASVAQSYVDWVLEIPFEKLSTKKMSMSDVNEQLNKDHYSLQKPKERIEEYFAIRELLNLRGLNNKTKTGVILCFAGPPGVGKTSLANSIATALGRSLVRIALGGLEDVNELRGHRRTYVGAMPGRVVQGLIEAKEMNPVFVLDEIDKISSGFRGDPTAVLLEILDPEQNTNFRDYYLNFQIDLSKIIFVATANNVSNIPAALRDRMEFIYLNSYTPQEKFHIAKNYLIPQELKKHGLKNSEVSISDATLKLIISDYTRESGVRNLRQNIASIFRKVAVGILKNGTQKTIVSQKNLDTYLDKKVYEIEAVKKVSQIGVVNGLAWTSVGGDILQIEAIKIFGKGDLQLTGQLGSVMVESAKIAFSLVKVLIDTKVLKISNFDNKEKQIYKAFDLHLHVPEGATPKDGPSAGITMVTAIASILSERKVKFDVAMTGEVTLKGKVLPIGGLKEKLIAAHKAKIKSALIPRKNYELDLKDIPQEVQDSMDIIPVDNIVDVLKIALI